MCSDELRSRYIRSDAEHIGIRSIAISNPIGNLRAEFKLKSIATNKIEETAHRRTQSNNKSKKETLSGHCYEVDAVSERQWKTKRNTEEDKESY